jgi:ATP-dependent DNA ligase
MRTSRSLRAELAEITNGKGKAATPFMTAKGAAAGSVWQSNRDDSAPAGLIAPSKAKPSTAKTKAVASLPTFVEPQLTKLLEKPPAGPGWAHEIKFDGYRMQLRTVSGKATLLSRKDLDWSSKFPEIVAAGAKLGDGIIDGEVVALLNPRSVRPTGRRLAGGYAARPGGQLFGHTHGTTFLEADAPKDRNESGFAAPASAMG